MMSDESDSDGFSSISDMSDSSDDDDIELNEPRVKNQNYLEETVPQYTDEVFFEHFRLPRETVDDIAQRFENSNCFNARPGQYGNISALYQVLIYLWYVGHQTASFRDVADRFDITISSVHRIIRRLTTCISNLSPQIIRWPNEDERQLSAEHFRRNGFKDIMGAIDGTHIKIDRPDVDPDSYINRKGYFSIQLQVVCDHKRKIVDLFVGYPGSVHDSRVFRNSPLGRNLAERCGRYFILGDSSYPLLPNLLTPNKKIVKKEKFSE